MFTWKSFKQPDYTGSDNREMLRVGNPDSLLDAVFMENLGGNALATVVFQIYVVPKGKQPEPSKQVLSGIHMDSIRLVWKSNDTLSIIYKYGDIYNFKNKHMVSIGKDNIKEVEIQLFRGHNHEVFFENDSIKEIESKLLKSPNQ